MVYLPLRKEGVVSVVERRSMRSGKAMVGGMMAGYNKKDSTNWVARLIVKRVWQYSVRYLCYKGERLIICATEVKYLHDDAKRSDSSLKFEEKKTIPK